jgi:hypothetical protein
MIKEEIVIEVTDNGLDEATKKANNLAKATKSVGDTTKQMAGEMRGASNSVLENGGAMGLLNDLTGGYAMMVKDAVEASVLFTKSQRIQTIQQKALTLATGTTTGAMKILRIALISTGIGAIVVAIGLLIANFDKVKKAVLNFIPGLGAIADIFNNIVEAVTDFIGVTSDATRALDKMVADSQASLKKNEYFLEANGDKFDEYTQRKIKSVIDFNKKVIELNEDEELSEKEKLERISAFRDKANREIVKADTDRNEKLNKAREEEAKKQADEAKRLADEAKKKRDEAINRERERVTAIAKILEDYKKKEEDALAKTNLDKINLEEQRALKELEILKATEEEKSKVRAYYANLRKEDEAKIQEELDQIKADKTEAERSLILDQKEWEIENEVDPVVKLEKQRELLEEQGQLDLDKLQADRDNMMLSLAERTQADSDYVARKQELNQALSDNENALAEQKKIRDKAVADNQLQVASQTLSLIGNLAKEGSALAKGVAVAQATMDTYKGAVSAYAAGSSVGGPAGVILGPVMAGLAVAAGLANIKKILSTKPIETGAPSGGASVPTAPTAPSFNLVQGTGANQIAESIGGQNQPLRAYVVSSNVTDAQAMDRNIVENSTL